MWQLVFLLVPLVLATESELKINNYIAKIDDGTLKSVQETKESSEELNLSNLGLRHMSRDALGHLSRVKLLNLSKNSLSSIPSFALINLTNLEHLDLANNEIPKLSNIFVGLNKLKSLNLSGNPLENLERGSLFGLSASIDVVVSSNLDSLSTGIFESPLSESENPAEPSVAEQHKKVGFKYNPAVLGPSAISPKNPESEIKEDQKIWVKVCVDQGKLKSLEVPSSAKEKSWLNCQDVSVENGKVSLDGLGIKSFEKNWYRLNSLPIKSVNLNENEIERVTSDLLNDLAAGVKEVTLRGNKIEALKAESMDNAFLDTLDLSKNFISEIEANAFRKLILKNSLILNSNRLKSLAFANSLPRNLTKLSIRDNEIDEIPVGAFSELSNLSSLELDGNNITEIHKQQLRGLPSVRFLSLSNNGLNYIEPGAFEGFTFLRSLDLDDNNLSSLEKNLFDGVGILLGLKLSGNKFSKINRETLAGLPFVVHYLTLDRNGIESLNNQSFFKSPILDLSLAGNKISSIEKGSFNLPTLRSLVLRNNRLASVDGESFHGMKSLKRLSLAGNGIEKLTKGAAKNLAGLTQLDLSKNPIRKLENGALFGLNTLGERSVVIKDTNVELVQGGLFSDV